MGYTSQHAQNELNRSAGDPTDPKKKKKKGTKKKSTTGRVNPVNPRKEKDRTDYPLNRTGF